jgi:putative flippase GtrA
MNTVLTFLLYEVLIFFVSYPVAYTASFVVGIVFAGITYAKVVFQVPPTVGTVLRFAAVYIASYLAGLGLLHLLVDYASIPAWLAPVFVLMITVPFNFLGSRLAIGRF